MQTFEPALRNILRRLHLFCGGGMPYYESWTDTSLYLGRNDTPYAYEVPTVQSIVARQGIVPARD